MFFSYVSEMMVFKTPELELTFDQNEEIYSTAKSFKPI